MATSARVARMVTSIMCSAHLCTITFPRMRLYRRTMTETLFGQSVSITIILSPVKPPCCPGIFVFVCLQNMNVHTVYT